MNQWNVYFESGKKKTFAGAIDWPGWCRSGTDEMTALRVLFEYGTRYARVLKFERIHFIPPEELDSFQVIEHLSGNTTTDFGAPAMPTSADKLPVGLLELDRFQAILTACWMFLGEIGKKANGKELRKGPRGGGRELDAIIRHVTESASGYLSMIGFKNVPVSGERIRSILDQAHHDVQKALTSAVEDGVPSTGPRGGTRWTPRYFVRRMAWHILDHAWEIEDRLP